MSIQWLDADMKELDESSGDDASYHPDCDSSSSYEEDLKSENESLDSLIEDSKKETEGKKGKVGHSEGKSKRQKKPCPLPTCHSVIHHIPRHLEEVHGWAKEHSWTALARFGLRKNYTYSDYSKVPKEKQKTNPEVYKEKKRRKKI
ncbi:uncharacterized protein [Montipora foliosa]|uniref:uncharacterized protein n=1 Tax=Montipora foliosa TaxID=591990 RepID=UPI0035F11A48